MSYYDNNLSTFSSLSDTTITSSAVIKQIGQNINQLLTAPSNINTGATKQILYDSTINQTITDGTLTNTNKTIYFNSINPSYTSIDNSNVLGPKNIGSVDYDVSSTVKAYNAPSVTQAAVVNTNTTSNDLNIVIIIGVFFLIIIIILLLIIFKNNLFG
jgi:hypothetical protein